MVEGRSIVVGTREGSDDVVWEGLAVVGTRGGSGDVVWEGLAVIGDLENVVLEELLVGVRGAFEKGIERLATGPLSSSLSLRSASGDLGCLGLRRMFLDSTWPDRLRDRGPRRLTDSELLVELSSEHIESRHKSAAVASTAVDFFIFMGR